ncbi:MAG: flotillin family protein [Pirellulales bacterium]|nr:flotillin family protein [Pirellulales bacterium]
MSNLSLYAANPGSGHSQIIVGIVVVLCLLLFFTYALVALKRYKRCPSNRVLVIFGRTGPKSIECVHGGSRFIWPLVQDYDWLSLEPIRIEIPLGETLNTAAEAQCIFTVAIGTTPELMQNAAIRLLGLTQLEIKQQAEDIIYEHLPQIMASMQNEDTALNHEMLRENIQKILEPDLQKIGLMLINIRIPFNAFHPTGR